MWWNLAIFALIGLLAGAAVRVFYANREPMRIVGTLVLATVGSLLGGMMSWAFWTEVDGQFSFGALVMSLLGAVVVLAVWPSVAYARSRRTPA
jgi:uncharacterized membrane protein YeaQ/YmgE (transglycosylase-associated protein family)